MILPRRLVASCSRSPEGLDWLARLPSLIQAVAQRWALTLDEPFDSNEVSCAWVAPAVRHDGTTAVLKVGMPHMEGEHEIAALRFWNGGPTVHLLEADGAANAMLLERCEPGTHLRQLPEAVQDVVIAGLLRRLRRVVPPAAPFRPLSSLTDRWCSETLADAAQWSDPGLVRAGVDLLHNLSQPRVGAVLLATDLHAGNVLRARREPWLAIDPKPFAGDAAYDATQHLLNCRTRLRTAPADTIRQFADLLDLDDERVRLWTFARAAAEPRADWSAESMQLARALAP